MTDPDQGAGAGRPGAVPYRRHARPRRAAQAGPARRTSIGRRLTWTLVVPLVAATGFAGWAVAGSVTAARQADLLHRLVVLGEAAGDAAHQVSTERAAAAAALSQSAKVLPDFVAQLPDTDAAVAAYQRERADLAGAGLPTPTVALLEQIDAEVTLLGDLREQVSGHTVALSAAVFQYRILGADLLTLRESVGQLGGADAALGDRLAAAGALARQAEAVGAEQAAVLRAIDAGVMTLAAQQEILAARATAVESALVFARLAPVEWRTRVDVGLAGEEVLKARQMSDSVSLVAPGERLPIDATQWRAAMDIQSMRLQEAVRAADDANVEEADARRDALWWEAAVQAGMVTVAIAVAIAVAVAMGRPLTMRLRALQQHARDLAYHQLPERVNQLSQTSAPDAAIPAPSVPALLRRPRRDDEVSDVVDAVGELAEQGTQIAVAEAHRRVATGKTFTGLARRGQAFAGQLTKLLDEGERNEDDPDRLAYLMRIDHRKTVWERTIRDLLVLGGATTAYGRQDTPLWQVLQAATSQVEQYPRVEMATAPPLLVTSLLVDDLVHLIASLLDNALRFSPPDTPVTMSAVQVTDHVVVVVSDEGLGIQRNRLDELNAALARPEPIGTRAITAMGLRVVAALAAHWSIRVRLTPRSSLQHGAQARGIDAEVSIPLSHFKADPDIPAGPAPAAVQNTPSSGPPVVREVVYQPVPALTSSQAVPQPAPWAGQHTATTDRRALQFGADGDRAWASAGQRTVPLPVYTPTPGWTHLRTAPPVEPEPVSATAVTNNGLPVRVPQPRAGGASAVPARQQRPALGADRTRAAAAAAAFARASRPSRASTPLTPR